MNITPMKDPRGYMTDKEVEKLLNACDNIRDYIAIRIMARTGIRVSELISIRVNNILFDENQIIIKIMKKRGERYRNVFIDKESLDIVKEYIKIKQMKPDDLILPITRVTIFYIVRKVGKLAGIEYIGSKRIHPHHFRHSFIMKGIKAGIDIRKMQMLAGHSSYNTTAGYLQYGSKELKTEYDKMFD